MMNSIDNLLVKIINIGKTEDKNTIFLIGNTAKIECNNFYFTPVRNYDQMIVAGIVVYKESIAKKIAKIFGFDESLVNFISIKESGLIAKRPVSPCLDNSKCSKILGYNFSDIDKGILKILNNFKNISIKENN